MSNFDEYRKNIETKLNIHTPFIAIQAVNEARESLGYNLGRNAISVYIRAKRDYVNNNPSPNIHDTESRKEYNFRVDVFALLAVREWIKQQERL